MPVATALDEMSPEELATRTGITFVFHPRLASAAPLLVLAPMTPATLVPWPITSELPTGNAPFATASQPATSLPARSGWVASTPLSITATTRDAEPCV